MGQHSHTSHACDARKIGTRETNSFEPGDRSFSGSSGTAVPSTVVPRAHVAFVPFDLLYQFPEPNNFHCRKRVLTSPLRRQFPTPMIAFVDLFVSRAES